MNLGENEYTEVVNLMFGPYLGFELNSDGRTDKQALWGHYLGTCFPFERKP